MVPLTPTIVVPSLAYHAPGGTLLTGAAAQDAALNPASHTSSFGRGFKRRLGDPTPLMLGGAAYSPAALMAAQLRDVLNTVTGSMTGRPESVVLTCPAVWGPYRREQFAEVPRMAGVDTFRLVTEPEAAATHYRRERALGDGAVVAVYDLGGGTLDTTVLRIRAGAMEILGTPEGVEHLGGMDFDDALLGHLDARLDGAITGLDPADPTESTALARIRALCVQAKIDLSTEPDVTLTVPLPAGPRELTVTRLEFNSVIRPSVELTVSALRRTVASARLDDDDLSAVLLAGGSSRVPLVRQMVFEEFDKPVRVTLHPKFTVALGAASIAAGDRHVHVRTPAVSSAESPDMSTAGPAQEPDPLNLFDDAPVKPYQVFIGSDENWSGKEVVGTASHAVISADDSDGLRVTWNGGGPAQVYLQTVNTSRNLQYYVDNEGALVFSVLVHSSGDPKVDLAAHCFYPCGAELDASSVFRDLPVGEPRTVRIPLRCFTEKNLNAKEVNTPFLVWSEGPLDVTFRDIAWVPGAAKEPGATSCADLP
jgi:molecular chaperone DnaK